MSNLYERKPGYWTRDLADREFEQAMKAELDALGWEYTDNTSAFDQPDFLVFRTIKGKRVRIAFELKDKRQAYRPGWADAAHVPETELLIVDEVALRKLLAWSPRAFLLFKDLTRPGQPYVLYTVLDLLCLPRVRVQRPISHQEKRLKAKWLIDRPHGHLFSELRDALVWVSTYLARGLYDDLRRLEPHGPFEGETIETL